MFNASSSTNNNVFQPYVIFWCPIDNLTPSSEIVVTVYDKVSQRPYAVTGYWEEKELEKGSSFTKEARR